MQVSRIDAELEHLLKWAKDLTGFQEYARWKANHLAVQEPVTWNELPLLLSNEVRSNKHGPPRPSTNQPRRSE